MVYKLFCLQSHYRKQLVYSEEGLDSAKSAYAKLIKRIASLNLQDKTVNNADFEKFDNQFKQALSNDLNTSLALTALYDVLKSDINDGTKYALIMSFDKVLGLKLQSAFDTLNQEQPTVDDDLKQTIETMIEQRKTAKANKDYATADAIRSKLAEMGVELIDTKDGTTYKIKG